MANTADTITLRIKSREERVVKVPWKRGMNIQKLLESAYALTGIPFVLRYYGEEMGQKVIMIDNRWDGDYGPVKSEKYWLLYLNNEFTPMGVNRVRVKPSDDVQFSYERFSQRRLSGESRY